METFEFTAKSRTILGDMHTPVAAYMKLRDLFPMSMLLESSDYHDPGNSRSFIGLNPMGNVAISHGKAIVTYPDGSVFEKGIGDSFMAHDAINAFLKRVKIEGEDKGVFGLFGYTSFNCVRYLEGVDIKDETMEKDDAPDLLYIMYRNVIEFDDIQIGRAHV